MQSLKLIQSLIEADLTSLEKCNLQISNKDKYLEFKNKFNELSKKIINYQFKTESLGISLNSTTIYSLKWEYAKLSADFDFYMSYMGGYKEVLSYQVNKIMEFLNKLIAKINQDNYQKVAEELREYLNLYQDILSKLLYDKDINDLIVKLKYLIYKYNLSNFVYDAETNYESFIPFILEDINRIINSNVSPDVKEELNKYLIDNSLIINNFNKIIIIINMIENNPSLTLAEIVPYLNRQLYKNSDISLQYDSKNSIHLNFKVNLDNIKRLSSSMKKEIIVAYINEYFKENIIDMYPVAEVLVNINFQEIIYLFESIICEKVKSGSERDINPLTTVIALYKAFKLFNRDYKYELICAIISCKEIIPAEYLGYFVNDVKDNYLINYVLNSRNLDLLTFYYQLSSNKNAMEKILELLDKQPLNDQINYIITHGLVTDFKSKIKAYLKDKNLDYILKFLEQLSSQDVLNILEEMSKYDEFKNVLNYVYKCIDLRQFPKNSITYKLICDDRTTSIMEQNESSNLNRFKIYFLSTYCNTKGQPNINILNFVHQYYHYNLHWHHLAQVIKKDSPSDLEEFYVYFYLGNKNEFLSCLEDKKINQNVLKRIITKYPESITDLLVYLNWNTITSLPTETLSIFSKYYEEKLAKDNTNISEKINTILSKPINNYQNKDVIELLVYIMATGLLNNELLVYIHNFINIEGYKQILLKAIDNAQLKYLKPFYSLKLLTENRNLDINFFLSAQELQEIKDSADGELKLKKYYGDLLRLLFFVSDNNKIRIALEITRSKIKDFIIYIKVNYPELESIILENITDEELYNEVSQTNVSNLSL